MMQRDTLVTSLLRVYRAIRRSVAPAVLAAAFALLATSCGSDSDDGSPSSPYTSVPSGTLAGSTQVPPLADAYGVTGTPTFIVNGTKVVGNVPLAALTSYFK